ncbi:ABC transporter ATP-binding protein [Alicyclobacillus sp. SO9]|uniref:ABC transporter ATP-binding protein n=1 Tax=Alicyclobacillus sp. SO9 TaxID=2665646 RepID=UPI0018E81665|nr:sn-glycerol-3-phosphate ABC transporter ATP-binding protein UgpC [Alicyclobacillus sp. SO9]QQE78988.1 sn-glycerol-3-phosphate ABC transporter ATP-binding protein UgpC [Alicyclobacillus sp. SO9]
MSSIHLKSLTKSYDNQSNALSDVSIEIIDGEFMVLVGPSGCGKSTLLRCLAGLETVTLGDIFVGDKRVNDVAAHKRNVAMVFQSYALYPNLSVFENIAFPLRAIRAKKEFIKQRVEEVAARLGLAEYLARKPRALSGGQRQRVAIARAIVRNPEAFLMDEPLSNLDAKLRHQMRVELLRLQRQLGTTTVFVTHDQVEAMTMGDRITVLNQGEVQQIGTPYEVYNRPANTFVASFIGSPPMNVKELRVQRGATLHDVRVEGENLFIPTDSKLQATEGDSVLVGIRPEDLTLTDTTNAVMQGVVDVVEYTGSETLLTVLTDSGEWVVKLNSKQPMARGNTVNLEVDDCNLYLFDKVTTKLMGTLNELSEMPYVANH